MPVERGFPDRDRSSTALHDSHVAELLGQAIFHVQHLTLGAREPLDTAAEAS